MQQRIAFFREHASYAVGQRYRNAVALAKAEAEAEARNWSVSWEDDDDSDERGAEVCYLFAQGHGPDAYGEFETGELLASVGGIVEPTSAYMRVIEAELAIDALRGRR